MVRIKLQREEEWIDLGLGVQLLVAPLTTQLMLEARQEVANELGIDEDGAEGRGDDAIALALAREVGRRVIRDWTGVEDERGRPAKVTPEGIDALLDLWPVFEAFQREYLAPGFALEQEKNASAPSPSGTSAGAGTTARPARRAAKSAPIGSTGRRRMKAATSGSS